MYSDYSNSSDYMLQKAKILTQTIEKYQLKQK